MTGYVFDFTEGDKSQKDLLGGKGANLAEMTKLQAASPHRGFGAGRQRQPPYGRSVIDTILENCCCSTSTG